MKRRVFLIVLLCLASQLLMGAITATYVANQSLYFDKGNKINAPNTPVGIFGAKDFVGYLGTITITAVGEQLRRPILYGVGTSNDFEFYGPFDLWNPNEIVASWFNIYMYSPLTNEKKKVYFASGADINGWGIDPIAQNPLAIDLFLVSNYDAKHYTPNAQYTLVSGTFGSFNIQVKDANHNTRYISVNGQAVPPGGGLPSTPTPIIPGTPTAPEIPFGEIPVVEPVTYDLTIVTDGAFALEQAYGFTQSAQVATAHMTVTNGEANKKYKVDLKFSNAENSPSFALKGEDTNHGYVIPYSLLFGGELVTGGGMKEWYTLDNGPNQRAISVTGVTRTIAEAAPADTFKDTIYVEVIPVE